MTKIHYLAASGATSVALMFGVALPAAAAPQETGPGDNTNTVTTNVDRSRTVNGNCSAIMEQEVEQNQNTSTSQTNANTPVNPQGNIGGLQALTDQSQSNSSTNSASQSNSSSNSQSNSQSFWADCSNHVTNVTQAAASSQVNAPKGGVGAGEGLAATSTSSIFGLVGSVVATGFGLGLRFLKRGL